VRQTQLDREQVARDIADKLGYAPGVSYSEIALKAADCGRKQRAIKVGCLLNQCVVLQGRVISYMTSARKFISYINLVGNNNIFTLV
jgi:hypothetical protein